MALSGTFNFNMTADEIFRKAAQRAGGGRLNGEELKDAAKSLNLVMRDILNRDIPLADICYWSEPLFTGTTDYELDPCIIDIHDAVIQNASSPSNSELGIQRYSYAEFNAIPNKTTTGRPTVFMTERNHDRVKVRVWPTPDRDYNLNMYVFIKPDDIFKYTDNIRLQPRYLPAVIAGLALEIAMDRGLDTERITLLAADYEDKLNKAQGEDRERVSFKVLPQLNTIR